MAKRPTLFLIDGSNNVYRAYYAIRNLTNSSGLATNAVYGFTSMLTKVMADEQPDHIAVAFDAPGGSTYRKELDSEYKAGRKETPDLFRSQLPLIHEVLEALEQGHREGRGTIMLNGRLVEQHHISAAKRVLALNEMIKQLEAL